MEEQRPWAIQIAVLATDNEIDQLGERLALALCPDPEHPGPCQNPWQIFTTRFDDLDEPERSAWADRVDDLLEQREHEDIDHAT